MNNLIIPNGIELKENTQSPDLSYEIYEYGDCVGTVTVVGHTDPVLVFSLSSLSPDRLLKMAETCNSMARYFDMDGFPPTVHDVWEFLDYLRVAGYCGVVSAPDGGIVVQASKYGDFIASAVGRLFTNVTVEAANE